jgi:gliding motility-associated-like protein
LTCIGKIITTTTGGTLPYRYKWNSYDTTANITEKCPDTYFVTITDKHGCKTSLMGTIILKEQLPQLDAKANYHNIYKSQKTVLTAIANAPDSISYHWIPEKGLDNPYQAVTDARPDTTTYYVIYATDKYGCNAADTITIFVKDFKCDAPYVFVPNAFSPNDDKINDILYVESKVVDTLYFAIYTRWGEKVFETKDITNGWDGIYKGEKLSPAVFVYYIDATCINKQRLQKKGNISLLR